MAGPSWLNFIILDVSRYQLKGSIPFTGKKYYSDFLSSVKTFYPYQLTVVTFIGDARLLLPNSIVG